MAKKNASEYREPLSPEGRIARALGLLLIKGLEQQSEQVLLLRSAGFEPSEIAEMLNVTPNYVSVAIYQSKNKPRRKKSK